MNTKQKGDIAESQVLAAFLEGGLNVLIPFGDRNRYDCVIEQDGVFKRVQVKTGRVKRTSVEFNSYSVTTEDGHVKHRSYRGQIDLFAVYCPELDQIYLIPIDLCRDRETKLSLTGVNRNQHKALVASDFEFHGRVAQSAEQRLDKAQVAGSLPVAATNLPA